MAIDADLVHNTGNETVDGVKTFTSTPLVAGLDITGGSDLRLKATAAGIDADPGDLVFADSAGQELGRI